MYIHLMSSTLQRRPNSRYGNLSCRSIAWKRGSLRVGIVGTRADSDVPKRGVSDATAKRRVTIPKSQQQAAATNERLRQVYV